MNDSNDRKLNYKGIALQKSEKNRVDNLYINVKENNSFVISNDFSYL